MKWMEEEKGVALVIAMLMLLIITLIGISSVNTTTIENRISGNKRISEQSFYIAEAGVNEFIGRFRGGTTGIINDNAPTNPQWRLYIAPDTETAQKIGYISGNPNHVFVQSLQSQLNFAAEIRHKVNIANNVITKAGSPIYIVTSYGFTSDGGNRIIETEFVKNPLLDPPSALYAEQPVNIHGSSTFIQGNDQCGSKNKPGIAITLPYSGSDDPIETSGNPKINGSPSKQ